MPGDQSYNRGFIAGWILGRSDSSEGGGDGSANGNSGGCGCLLLLGSGLLLGALAEYIDWARANPVLNWIVLASVVLAPLTFATCAILFRKNTYWKSTRKLAAWIAFLSPILILIMCVVASILVRLK